MTRIIAMMGFAGILASQPAWADEAAPADEQDQIVVTGYAATKTDTALIELPQPIKVITAEQYQAQGAISISDTVKYAAGVLANPYGRDTRVDGFNVRGLDALQFRDGTPDTDVVLTGLYQKDKTGSTSQFLPIVGTFLPNPGAPRQLDMYTFVGKPGWDRYAGRSLQGMGAITHDFSDKVRLSVKARYIDSKIEYFTHYADSYANPTDPFAVYGTDRRTIRLYADASDAFMKVFSTDNNLQFTFNTGDNIEHKLLVGLDYSWNKVGKRYAFDMELIDLYDIDYDALLTYDPSGPFAEDSQKQLGIYVQDQIRFYDRVSVVLGARRDRVTSSAGGKDTATTFRAGIIGEIGAGFSPFFSYTESFLPLAGSMVNADGSNGAPYRPQTGTQFEAGVKWQPGPATLVTVTAFHIRERNRVLYLASGATTQSGKLTTKGFEIEASHALPGDFELLVNYGYSELKSETNTSLDYMPRHTASIWSTKSFGLTDHAKLRLGAGVVYNSNSKSTGPLDPYGLNPAIPAGALYTVVTPARTTVDALAEITWANWRLALNATNLLNNKFYASCLARGDCFMGAPRNVMATVGYSF